MSVSTRAGLFALLMGSLALVAGCSSPGALFYFLLPEPKEDPLMRQLADDKAEKPPRVVVLVSSGLETRAEFIHADRQLAELVAKHIEKLTRDNKEKLTIISPRKVEAYKSRHPDWKQHDPRDVGKVFDANYIIDLEINGLELYERGTAQEFYRGRVDLNVALIDMKNADEDDRKPFNCVYPSEARGYKNVGFDTTPAQFRLAFLNHVAQQISWHFVRYPRRASLFTE